MLENIIFLLMWLLLPVFWYYLLKVAGLSLFRVTIPSFVVGAILCYQYIGLPVLYFQLDAYRAQFITDKWIVLQVFLYTSLTVTLMIIGFVAARYSFGQLNWNRCSYKGVREQTHILQKIKHQQWGGFKFALAIIPLVLLSVIVLMLYVSKIGLENVAVFLSFGVTDSELSVEVARSRMGNSFEGRHHWYRLFMNDILRFSLFAIFAQCLMQKNNYLSRTITTVLLVITFLITTFVMVMAIEKGPMVNLLIALFLIYVIVKKGGRIPKVKFFFLSSFLLIVLCFFYINFMGVGSVSSAITSVASRTFTGQIAPAYHYLDYFQQNQELLLGRTFPNPRGIFHSNPFELTTEIMNWVHPDRAGKGVVGSMPTIYWGEMYANFGFLGVLIPPFFVGFALYLLNSLLFRFSFNPLSIALFAWLLMHYKSLSSTGPGGFIFDISLITIFIVFVSLNICLSRKGAFFKPDSVSVSNGGTNE